MKLSERFIEAANKRMSTIEDVIRRCDFIKVELKSLLEELNNGELNKDEKRIIEIINGALASSQIGVHYNMTGVKLFIQTAKGVE